MYLVYLKKQSDNTIIEWFIILDGVYPPDPESFIQHNATQNECDLLQKYEMQNIEFVNNKIQLKNDFHKQVLIDSMTPEIYNKKNTLIQTVSGADRVLITENPDDTDTFFYEHERWQHFYQKCQNIRMTDSYTPEQQNKARELIERIYAYTNKKNDLIRHMKTLTVEQLEAFNPLDDQWWTLP